MISVDFYFYHIPKCAGTALRQAIYQSFKDKYRDDQIHIPGYNVPIVENIPRLIATGCGDAAYLKKLKVIADHSRPGQLAEFLGTEVTVKFGVTALRHPVDRAMSIFHYFKRGQSPVSLEDLSPHELQRWVRIFGNGQTAHLANAPLDKPLMDSQDCDRALATLRSLDSIIIFEDLARSVDLLNRVNPLNASLLHPSPTNVTRKDRDYSQMYSEDFRKSLEDYCANDLRLYAEGSMLFRKLCEEQGLA
jgi:hypothetical protein